MANEKRPLPRGGIGRERHHHTGIASTESYVHYRHPDGLRDHGGDGPGETYLLDIPGSEGPEEGTVSLDVPCDPFADTSCYPLDDFDRTLVADSYTPGDAWSAPVHYGAGESSSDDGDTPFYLVVDGAPYDYSIDSYLGTKAYGKDINPGIGCTGSDFTFTGWVERTHWMKFTVPTVPSSAAGITIGPMTFSAPTGISGGTVGQAEGALLVVNSAEPAGTRDGTLVGALPHNVATTVFIPSSYIPAEGQEFWVGIVPNWTANYGSYTCGFSWPWMNGDGNSAQALVTSVTDTPTWQVWDVSGDDWGYGVDGDDYGAFFDGNLPWDVAASGGTFGYNGDHLYLTVPAGTQETLVATMKGVSASDIADDYEEAIGEPWTSEFGVRMKARWRLTTAGSLTEAGRRYLSFRWQDGRNEYKALINLGDLTAAQGVVVSDETSNASVLKDITEGAYMWVSLDSRNAEYLRVKMWAEGGAFGAGEPAIFDAQVGLDDTTEISTDGNFFEIAMSVGNETGAAQTVEVDGVWFCNGADDCLWVSERIGQADSSSNKFATSMPYKTGSLWFFVDGLHVRTISDDDNQGTFYGVQYLQPDDGAVLVARYRVDLNPDGD